jgi:hypothetical protein
MTKIILGKIFVTKPTTWLNKDNMAKPTMA